LSFSEFSATGEAISLLLLHPTFKFLTLTWSYLKQKLAVPVHFKDKVCTISTIRSNDLATLWVKSWIPCEVMRVEERDSINRVMAVFGISAIGVRKQPPANLQRLMNQGKWWFEAAFN
jgi:hypothetical protein